MITEIRIQNFKSIRDLNLKLGRVTVLIGENGSGKSNILEGIVFAAGAATNKLDNEYLANRGIRVTEEAWMRSAFPEDDDKKGSEEIGLTIKGHPDFLLNFALRAERRLDDGSFIGWSAHSSAEHTKVWKVLERTIRENGKFSEALRKFPEAERENLLNEFFSRHLLRIGIEPELELSDFMIYAPENTTLRNPPAESAIEPLGTKGEGLFKLLQTFSDSKFADRQERLDTLKENLRLFGWFDDFDTPDSTGTALARLLIRDRWLDPKQGAFDQRSANEGFLFLLFYFALLTSWRTPRFFALDNIDNALNPKLCSTLMQRVVELAKKYDKQVICTTHNPAILDGLNLNDDEQRLYTVERDSEGATRLHRVRAPKPRKDEVPVRLSEAFIEGLIGGLPENF